MAELTENSDSASWDNYWQGAQSAAAFSSGGVNHPVLGAFWREFFSRKKTLSASARAIDIASGNGALIEAAQAEFADACPQFTCLDVSAAAVAAIKQRFPEVTGMVADARATTLPDGGFDMAISQFGVEYAGREAVFEMARLLAVDGTLGLIMHCRQGSIYAECAASLDAIQRLQASEFLPRAIALFEAGFAACQGADRAGYDEAARHFAPAIGQLEAIMLEHGPHVAGDTLLQLHENVDRFHQRMAHYEPAEVLGWLTRLGNELQAYAGRMQSMCEAALDRPAFEAICEELERRGFRLETAHALTAAKDQPPLAWVLVARNSAAGGSGVSTVGVASRRDTC